MKTSKAEWLLYLAGVPAVFRPSLAELLLDAHRELLRDRSLVACNWEVGMINLMVALAQARPALRFRAMVEGWDRATLARELHQ